MSKTRIIIILCALMLVSFQQNFAQTLPVGILEGVESAYRRQQLLGNDSSRSSFLIRPLFMSDKHNVNLSEEPVGSYVNDFRTALYVNPGLKASIYALPLVWQQQINTHHPYGWNDGGMIPAKGYQTSISGGLFAEIGPLSVQFRPEYVYAVNTHFAESLDAGTNTPELNAALRRYHNFIDAPERFGTGNFSQLNWGQSSVRLNFNPVSIGLSNENLWWGPGMRNSLLMSNTAPGFKHLTLNTSRPVNTPIGSLEAQIIAGRLEDSGIAPRTDKGVTQKRDDWRYISGIALSYQPKWVPGLFLGFDRTYTSYRKDMGSSFSDYFPIFSAFGKKAYRDTEDMSNSEDQKTRDQIFSLYARWVMPESHSEIYFQYGREDHSWDLRDAFVEAEHSRAYVAGFVKMIPLNRPHEFIQAAVELTQTEPAGTQKVRGETSWYTHTQIRHGYTHRGHFLGAGIGPDNMQSLNVDWVKGLKRIGLLLERRVHNNDIYYRAFSGATEFRRHWVDLGLGSRFDWEFKKFILNSQIVYTRALNYQYEFKNQSPTDIFVWDKNDVNNLHFKVGLMYRL